MKVLFIHMAALGDGIMASPAFELLKRELPQAELHVLARSHVVRYFESLPYVDKVIPFADQRWLVRKKPWLMIGAMPGVAKLVTDLTRQGYDAVLQWRGQFVDSMLSCATRAPVRIAAVHGYHRKAPVPVERTPWLMTDLVELPADSGHVVDAMVAPVKRLIERVVGREPDSSGLRMHFPVCEQDRQRGDSFLADHGLVGGKFACVSFSSKTDANSWPPERFAAVADHLFERHGLPILLDGLPIHRDREAAIAAAMRTSPVRSAGRLSLGEIATVIGRSRIVVCFNSAPMHLASAFGVPVVVIGGRDGSALNPWAVPSEVVTKNPFYPARHPVRAEWPKLVPMVHADEVIEALDRVLAMTAKAVA